MLDYFAPFCSLETWQMRTRGLWCSWEIWQTDPQPTLDPSGQDMLEHHILIVFLDSHSSLIETGAVDVDATIPSTRPIHSSQSSTFCSTVP